MVPPLRFRLQFYEGEELGADFQLRLDLWLPGRYEILGGELAMLISLLLIMQLFVASLSK